jgi:hypothetical protein
MIKWFKKIGGALLIVLILTSCSTGAMIQTEKGGKQSDRREDMYSGEWTSKQKDDLCENGVYLNLEFLDSSTAKMTDVKFNYGATEDMDCQNMKLDELVNPDHSKNNMILEFNKDGVAETEVMSQMNQVTFSAKIELNQDEIVITLTQESGEINDPIFLHKLE